MTTYNGEKYLPEQLDSLFFQTVQNWNLVISDDGSTDATLSIVGAYELEHEGRVKLVQGPRRGSSANFLLTLKHLAGTVLFCDQDDVWSSDKVERSVEALERMGSFVESASPALVVTTSIHVDAELNPLSSQLSAIEYKDELDYLRHLLCGLKLAQGCTLALNSELVELIKLSASEIASNKALWYDWWTALVAAATGQVHIIREPMLKYRIHSGNLLGSRPRNSIVHKAVNLFSREWRANAREEALLSIAYSRLLLRYYGSLIPQERFWLVQELASIPRCSILKRARIMVEVLPRDGRMLLANAKRFVTFVTVKERDVQSYVGWHDEL